MGRYGLLIIPCFKLITAKITHRTCSLPSGLLYGADRINQRSDISRILEFGSYFEVNFGVKWVIVGKGVSIKLINVFYV